MRSVLCVFACISVLASGGAAQEASRPKKSPNILWLVSDDHAAYVCKAYGNRQARTPTIDRLAAEGIRFERAYCNSPLCSASRQSFLTGRLPHATGVTLLQTPFPDREVTLAEHLRPLGYQTAAIGKMHFNNKLAHGFAGRINYPEYHKYLKSHKPKPVEPGIEVLPAWKPFRDPARVWLNGMYHPFGRYDNDMPGTYFARQGVEYMRENRDKPFFLIVSLYEPHSPFRFPIEYRGMFDPAEMPLHRPGPEDAWQIPAIFEDLTDAEKQRITAAYYTSTAFMDKNMGIVLKGLAEAGLKRDTLICYFGDHGYSLGQHGRFEKHCFYEPAVRAPLVFSWQGRIRAGQSSQALVEFVDIVPTVLDLCGLPAMKGIHGRSVRPVIDGQSDRAREYVFSEYLNNETAMIRTDRYKLVYTTGKRKRTDGYWVHKPLTSRKVFLYDTKVDAEEFHNIADRPDMRETRQRLLDLLEKHLIETQNERPRFPESATQVERIDKLLVPPELASS